MMVSAGGRKERRCSRRLLRKSKLQHLRVARVRAASSTSWTIWGLGGTRGRHSPARGSTHRPRCRSAWGGQLWRTQEDAGGRPRRWADWGLAPGAAVDGASRWGMMCWLPRSAAVPPRTAGQSPRRCRRTAPPGRWGRWERVPCRRPSSLPGLVRDGAPEPPWGTSPSRGPCCDFRRS